MHAEISKVFQFYRKHYFYPDLPKGYQISQYDRGGAIPLGKKGFLTIQIDGNSKKIRINRIQVEEDPAKLVYPSSILESNYVLIDYNRSGTPLLEIVTEPDISSPQEARLLLEKLYAILVRVGVIDSESTTPMRCDANVSVEGHPRVEIKNIGSFKDVEKALNFEIIRMQKYISEGISLKQETRHWDSNRKITVLLREKEEEADYRYFPDPNIPLVELTEEFLESALKDMPKLPDDAFTELTKKYQLSPELANVLVYNSFASSVFEKLTETHVDVLEEKSLLSEAASLIVNELIDLKKRGYIERVDEKLIDRIYYIAKISKEGGLTKPMIRTMLMSGIAKAKKHEIAEEKLVDKVISDLLSKNKDLISKALQKESVKSYLVGKILKSLEEKELWYPPDAVSKKVTSALQELKDTIKPVIATQKVSMEKIEVKEKITPEKETIETLLPRVRSLRMHISDVLEKDLDIAYIAGWIESKMKIGKIIFAIIRDGTGRIQTVIKKQDNEELYHHIEETPLESFVFIVGAVRRDERAPGGKELKIQEYYVISKSSELKVPLIQLGTSSLPVRLHYRYLDIRRRTMRTVLYLRSRITHYVREFFMKEGFTEIHTPKIIGTATEGGAELFPLLYYGREAFLAQSPQLYKQMALNAFERVFEISAYFRAQPYDTPRHLSEFWSIDAEAVLFGLDDLLETLEKLIHYIKKKLEKNESQHLKTLNVSIPKLPEKFPRLTYSEIIEQLTNEGVSIKWGDDLSAEALHHIANEVKSPFFIIEWPATVRAFYYRPDPYNPKVTRSFDLMWPTGHKSLPIELSSGGERINDIEILKRNLQERGLFPESYGWYIEMFKYGMPPHAGFGLGLDRLVQAILAIPNIVDTIMCPRNPKYLVP